MNLSKSDYIMGDFCPKALWLKKHKPELLSEEINEWSSSGYSAEDLAKKLYPDGIEVSPVPFSFEEGARLTKKLSLEHNILFEAVAKLPWGAACRIDILQKEGKSWNLIEIKSTTAVKPEQITDMAFQYYVFSNAGYKIKNCSIVHLNKDYRLHKKLDIKKLFVSENVTTEVAACYDEVEKQAAFLSDMQNHTKEPKLQISKKCKSCDFYDYCCVDVPSYSIWDIFPQPTADKICQKLNSYDVNDLDASEYKDKKFIDISSWQNQEIYCDKEKLREFLSRLKYPLYYLDYETIEPAIPLFENSGPYQHIPFQFSLHIQDNPKGPVKHIGFLHKERTDPRRALAEALVKSCGQKGSVIVYNESFEKKRNEELAGLFPDLAEAILSINSRVLDQLVPFRQRMLYHYNQHSSASIKKVLPSFTALSYDNLEVKNGGEAMSRYFKFMMGELSTPEEQTLFDGLEVYCGQDTFAMVELMEVLYKFAA